MASEKKLLKDGQFFWVVSAKDAKYYIHVGPDPLLNLSDDDQFLVPDKDDPGTLKQVDDVLEAIQRFVTVDPDHYVVIYNPAESFSDQHPNGSFSKQRNDMKTLSHGTKRVVIAGHFPLIPAQWHEKRPIHKIESDDYLIVEVESEDVDVKAPYYELTVRCAEVTQAVVDDTVKSEEGKSAKVTGLSTEEGSEGSGSEGEDSSEAGVDQPSDKTDTDDVKADEADEPAPKSPFTKGQRIRIPGSMTQTYIPPTGIEIVPEESGVMAKEEEKPEPVSSSARPKEEVLGLIQRGVLNESNYQDFTSKSLGSDYAHELNRSYRGYRDDDDYNKQDALYYAITHNLEQSEIGSLVKAVLQPPEKKPFAS